MCCLPVEIKPNCRDSLQIEITRTRREITVHRQSPDEPRGKEKAEEKYYFCANIFANEQNKRRNNEPKKGMKCAKRGSKPLTAAGRR